MKLVGLCLLKINIIYIKKRCNMFDFPIFPSYICIDIAG